jgi:phosphoribosylformylglycinamidine synthase subunit PurS
VRYVARVDVSLRPGIADPEGATIERALSALGFDGIASVRAGRSFHLELDATNEEMARSNAAALADRLLANPVIEQYEIEVTEL